jgi:hypothetical protein
MGSVASPLSSPIMADLAEANLGLRGEALRRQAMQPRRAQRRRV